MNLKMTFILSSVKILALKMDKMLLFLKAMLTITNHTLEKLELLLKAAGYRVR